MKADRPYYCEPPRTTRRIVLGVGGIALALPMLEIFAPQRLRSLKAATSSKDSLDVPRRLIAICNNLGVLPQHFFPEGSGKDYQLTSYLAELAEHRERFTVLSGVSHPGVDGSHSSDVSFLTAAPHPASGGFRNTISLDQYIASRIGHHTRFPSLTLGVNVKQGRRSLSWTEGGVLIPCQDSAAAVYRQLFLQGSESEIQHQIHRLELGQSIMDSLGEQAKALGRRLGANDRDRMDQFTTAVRDVEQRMVQTQQWQQREKPVAPGPQPVDPSEPSDYLAKTQLIYQMARLAVETDSTRAITILLDSNNSPTISVPGETISDGYHNLSHHGQSESKLRQLEAIDRAHMRLLGELIGDLNRLPEGDGTLLQRTTVLYGSNFGDANKHVTDNMPMLVAGGGLRHGLHLAFDRQKNYPLPNLFVTILQQMGFETDRFASSTGTLRGLEIEA